VPPLANPGTNIANCWNSKEAVSSFQWPGSMTERSPPSSSCRGLKVQWIFKWRNRVAGGGASKGGWRVSQIPILGSTITVARLKSWGYILYWITTSKKVKITACPARVGNRRIQLVPTSRWDDPYSLACPALAAGVGLRQAIINLRSAPLDPIGCGGHLLVWQIALYFILSRSLNR